MMAYLLAPLCVVLFFIASIAVEKQTANDPASTTASAYLSSDASSFITYRNAVEQYQRLNPTFIGEVSDSNLVALGFQFSSEFLARAGNGITQVGAGAGRAVTVYGNLEPGSLDSILDQTEGDYSYGISSGTNWISAGSEANQTPVALQTAVPSGYIVSVIQIGE